MTPFPPDRLLDALSELATPPRAASRDARTRSECHALMTARPTSSRWFTPTAAAVGDRLLPIAAATYGLGIVIEALRLTGII
jgi:hypothetical protein